MVISDALQMHAPEKSDNGNCIHVILGKFQSIKKLSILPYPHFTLSTFYPVRILPHPHFTQFALYPTRILLFPHFTLSAFHPIRILYYPHFTQSALYPTAFYPIRILPCLHFNESQTTCQILQISVFRT